MECRLRSYGGSVQLIECSCLQADQDLGLKADLRRQKHNLARFGTSIVILRLACGLLGSIEEISGILCTRREGETVSAGE